MAAAFNATRHHVGPARLRIAMLTGSAQSDPAAHSARVHLDRLAFQLTRMGHSVDLDVHDGMGEDAVAPGPGLAAIRRVPLGLCSQAIGSLVHRAGPVHDIAHALTLSAGAAALRLHQASGLPFVIAAETPGWPRAASGRAGADADADAMVLRSAARILSPGTQHSRQLERLYRIAPTRIVPALRGFAPEELWPLPMAEARARLGLDQQRFMVLYLGRIAPRKGIDTLIQAIALLRRRHGVDAGLLVAGGGAHESVELARLGHLASELGVGAHVQFAGLLPRASLRDFYAAANVFASTPWYEPFGMAPLEAMACARPVVASELGGIGELVDDGRSGFLIPPRDPDALADRLARLHRHPGLAHAMGEAGRRRACEHHTWRRQAAQLLALYREVLRELRQPAHPLAS